VRYQIFTLHYITAIYYSEIWPIIEVNNGQFSEHAINFCLKLPWVLPNSLRFIWPVLFYDCYGDHPDTLDIIIHHYKIINSQPMAEYELVCSHRIMLCLFLPPASN